MGCDIHMHLEVKIDNQWEHYGAPSVSRNYELFEKLGARGDIENAMVTPKGIPADATKLTALDYKSWEGDAHTASWLSKEEIMVLEGWLKGLPGDFLSHGLEHVILKTYLFGNSFTGPFRYPEENCFNIQDVRFVFWFDN